MKKINILFMGILFLSLSCSSQSQRELQEEPLKSGKKISIIGLSNLYLELETCGCIGNQLGGLHRLHNLLSTLKLSGSTQRLLLSGGSNLVPRGAGNIKSKSARDASQKKGRFLVEALNKLDMTTLSPNIEEFAFGLAHIKKLEKLARFPFISSNLVHANSKKLLFKPYLSLNGGGVLILGVSKRNQKVFGADSKVRVLDPKKSIQNIIKNHPHKNPMIILLSSLTDKDRKTLLTQVPEIDIVIGGDNRESTSKLTQYKKSGLYFNPLDRGRVVGKLDLEFNEIHSGFYWASTAQFSRATHLAILKEIEQLKKKASHKKATAIQKTKWNKEIKENELVLDQLIPYEPSQSLTTVEFKQFEVDESYEKPINEINQLVTTYKKSLRPIKK